MATNSTTEALLRAAREAETAADDLNTSFTQAAKSVNKLETGIDGLGNGATQFFRALTDGQKGMAKYGASIQSAASGISGFLSLLGPLGAVAGVLVKGLGLVAASVLNNNDKILEAYDMFAEFGGTTKLTADSLAKLRETNSAALKNFNNLAKVTGDLGGNLIALGNTSGEGIERFINIANLSDEYGQTTIKEFSKFGWTQEKLTAVQASYIKNQVAFGTIRGKTDDELRKESIKFAKELIEYSALTGKTTDEIQNIQKEAQNDYKYVSAMREMAEKGDTASVEAFKNLNTRIAGTFGATHAAGLRDLIANKGVATTEAGRKLLASTQGEINAILDKFAKDKNVDQFEKSLQDIGLRTEKTLGAAGRANPELADLMLLPEGLVSQGKNLYDGRTKSVQEDIARKKDQIDSITDLRAENEIVAQKLGSAFATLMNLISGPINNAFQGLLKGVEYLTDALTNSWIGKKLGFTSGLADFSMKPLAELSKLQSENAVEIAKKEKELREAPKVTIGNTTDYVNPLHTNKLIDQIKDLKNSQNLIALELSNRKNTAPPVPATSSQSASPSAAAQSVPAPSSDPSQYKPKFRTGGIFKGPSTGYSVTDTDPMTSELPKAVIPLPSGQEIPVSFKDLPKDLLNKEQNLLLRSSDIDNILAAYMKTLIGSGTTATETMMPSMADSINMNDILALVTDKMDSLIYKMNQNIEVQNDLLILARK